MIFDSIFDRNKKRCVSCGCNLEPDSEFDICECCLDELLEIDNGSMESYE